MNVIDEFSSHLILFLSFLLYGHKNQFGGVWARERVERNAYENVVELSASSRCEQICSMLWEVHENVTDVRSTRIWKKKQKENKKNSLDISSILDQNPTTNTYIRKEALKTHILKSPIKSYLQNLLFPSKSLHHHLHLFSLLPPYSTIDLSNPLILAAPLTIGIN